MLFSGQTDATTPFSGSSEKTNVNSLALSEHFGYNNLLELFNNYCRVLLLQPLGIVCLALHVDHFILTSRSVAKPGGQNKDASSSPRKVTSRAGAIDGRFYADKEIDIL